MTDKLADRAARREALDPGRSFIVQAPAGSGKTELLTQRFLALLATVEAPEEIFAMTFTRKAAGEMRQRIIQALARAGDDTEPEQAHQALTWKLARAARQRDEEMGWQLDQSPGRLRVMTIDALHALISRQMPIMSGAGGALTISQRPSRLYELAATRTLQRVDEPGPDGRSCLALLRHRDNRFDRARDMLAGLLGRRDQWLARVTGPRAMGEAERRAWLEGSIRRQVEEELRHVCRTMPAALGAELPALCAFAAANLQERGTDSPVLACAGLSVMPDPDADALGVWCGVAELLLTRKGDWRKTVTVGQGMPAKTIEKERLLALLQSLTAEHPWRPLLHRIRDLPPWRYDDVQWEILGNLLTLLPICAAELELVMREQGEADYVAVAQAARRALGDEDQPTDLALSLDYRIRHLLLDEFQDTSIGQVQLLRQLTAGWEQSDGRSLFCVGDPMQSIYAFREAEVGLFLQVRRDGRINEVAIDDLVLEVNFRSDRGLVEWVNDAMRDIMPTQEDPRLGAVTFTAAEAWHPEGNLPPVRMHSLLDDDGSEEASRVVQVIRELQAAHQLAGDRDGRDEQNSAADNGIGEQPSIAVLVRARNHLAAIVHGLKAAGMTYKAVDIEPLAQRPVIQDLMALTRALSHPGDRTAWLALMRAPWCGLRLDDIEILAGDRSTTVSDSIRNAISQSPPDPRVSADARRRIEALHAAVSAGMALRGRRPLHRLVEGVWLALGGPATLPKASDLEDARNYFQRLRGLEIGGDLDDVATLEARLDDLYAAPDPTAGEQIQLMTIHKAKGLQFDYVLLPGLHRLPGGGDTQLLHWLEISQADGQSDLLLATVEERGADRDPLHKFLKRLETRKAAFELERLLYVAATRARRQMHLFATLRSAADADADADADRSDIRPPQRGSMLDLLWPGQARHFLASLEQGPDGEQTQSQAATVPPRATQEISRLTADWLLPPAPGSAIWQAGPALHAPEPGRVEFWWAGRGGRAVGTVVHRWLERMANDGLAHWSRQRISESRDMLGQALVEQGLSGRMLDEALAQVMTGLDNTLADERGRWILSAAHEDARSELAIAGNLDGTVAHLSIDRSFRDADGQRWVIDFKTGAHEGADLETYLDREVERYREQLERYARLVANMHPGQPVRVGLYFPLHRAWRSWTPGPASE